MLFAIGIIAWLSWLRARNPAAADTVIATWSGYNAYRAHQHGHNGIAALHAANAAGYAYRVHERTLADAEQLQHDHDYWSWVATQPLPYQWQIADWYRSTLQHEYARRVHGRIHPDYTPVPSYDDIVAYLHTTPTVW